MSGPWEKYGATSRGPAEAADPWTKYASPSAGNNFAPPGFQEGPGILESVGEGILDGLSAAGEFVDSYSGAPTRAALDALVRGEGGGTAAERFANQFGADPSLAPTGKEIAERVGLSGESLLSFDVPVEGAQGRIVTRPGTNEPMMKKEVSPAGVAGLAIDITADPLNFIPVGFVAKGGTKLAGKAAKEGTKLALKGTVAAADAALDSRVISRSVDDAKRAVDNVVKNLKRSWNPTRAEDFEEFVSIAQKHNIDPSVLPETVEFGPHSTITKKAKTIAEGPGGEPIQKRFRDFQNNVAMAVDNHVKRLGGGEKMLDSEAGQMLTDAYNRGVKSFFDQDLMTHKKVIAQNPDMILTQDSLKSVQSNIKGLKDKATGRVRRGIGGQQDEAKQLLKDIDVLERSLDENGNLSYERAMELLTNIGEEAFKKNPVGSKTPIDQKALQDIYFSLRDAMYESVSHAMGTEVATEMAMNNQIISQFLKEQGAVKKIFEGDAAPEKIIKSIIDNGDTKKLSALKEILTPEDMQKLKGVMANKIIARNAEGEILYRTTLNKLERKKDLVSAIFNPQEIEEFGEVLRLGDRGGDFIFNTSNTNTAARFSGPKKFVQELFGSAYDEVTLERLKDIARGQASPVPAAPSGPNRASGLGLRQIPLLESRSRQTLESGRLASLQERNETSKKRKRAISGRTNGNR